MRMLRMLPLLGLVLIPGFASSPVTSSPEWSGFLGRSLSVVCQYDKGYETYSKYWCKGDSWVSCKTVVKTRGSEAEVKNGRTSIKDNHTLSEFTVRLDDLTKQDAGIYWCVIEKTGSDLVFRVNITVLPAPTTLHPEGGSTATKEPPSGSSAGPAPSIKSEGPTSPSTVSLLYVPFLISVSLKTPIFLCMVFAIIWMSRRSRQHSEEGKAN